MGLELVIFILIGMVSITAAVMMLISDNAVHSALFLIINFGTVAFMYLMLHAPFLAMVQITVYAGAIMVLFLFVIMLLGAEKVLPQSNQQFRWTTPAAIAVVTLIFLIASVAVISSDIDASHPHEEEPVVRLIHADSSVEAVDVYLDETMLADDLPFAESTEFEHVSHGEKRIRVVEHGASLEEETPLLDEMLSLEEGQVLSLVVLPEAINGSRVLVVEDSLDPVEDRGTSRLTVVHAAAECPVGSTCTLDLANVSYEGESPVLMAEGLTYGTVFDGAILRRDRYDDHVYSLGIFEGNQIALTQSGPEDTSASLAPLFEKEEHEVEDNHSLLWVVMSDARADTVRFRSIIEDTANTPSFGSARGVGQVLFTTYLLPFELIAVLLLVAMIGVIILTKDADQVIPRRRNVRRMAAIPGNPTVEEYLKAVEAGQPLPPPAASKQLPESTGD